MPTPPAKKADHAWVVAAELPVETNIARYADFRGSFVIKEGGQRVNALEVYCKACKRPFEDVADQECSALIDNRHLIGGDQRVRAKRLPPPQPPKGARVIPGHTYTRRGIEAYVAGTV
ncbi:hypothetical protein [Actinacidiphila sp. bgisy160]|uniref:hypothetical protein n=1 Tax=Actinacidiphila sp. bgisy160 TaxID=3413796 RepID=UPI003D7584E8